MLLQLSSTPFNWHVRISWSCSWCSWYHIAIHILVRVLTVLTLIGKVLRVFSRLLWVIIYLVQIIFFSQVFVFFFSVSIDLCALGINRSSATNCTLALIKLLSIATSALRIVVCLTLGHSYSARSSWRTLSCSIVNKSIGFRFSCSCFNRCWLIVVL